MSNYSKPTVSLIALNASSVPANCANSTADAKEILDILAAMGYDLDKAFGMTEQCDQPVTFEDYCKFSSTIRVFTS